jgi:hypothetical protein
LSSTVSTWTKSSGITGVGDILDFGISALDRWGTDLLDLGSDAGDEFTTNSFAAVDNGSDAVTGSAAPGAEDTVNDTIADSITDAPPIYAPSTDSGFDDGSNPGEPLVSGYPLRELVWNPTETYGISGSVDRSGILEYHIRAGSNTPRGAVMFSRMMKALGGPESMAGINGNWTAFEDLTTNLDQFNANIAAGMTDEAAALRTFTGSRAVKYGFPNATVVSKIGDPPEYLIVIVHYR